jgi:hypothetical protein
MCSDDKKSDKKRSKWADKKSGNFFKDHKTMLQVLIRAGWNPFENPDILEALG